ncbi:MAG TPA: hypothetical protein VHQ21_02755, partial [Rhodanobacteraceae bacterium]|nr:hypothetical protein [Rhodanobacteraceae bacterium]
MPLASLLCAMSALLYRHFASVAFSVGQPVKPLPDVRRPDARSAQIAGPDGISQCFQVSAYSGEPYAAILARNLLSKDACRPALRDEVQELGPQMPLVGGST